jgi:hypothetical protein
MATKGIKRRQKKSAVEAVGPPFAWGAYYKGLAAQQHNYGVPISNWGKYSVINTWELLRNMVTDQYEGSAWRDSHMWSDPVYL